MSNSGMEKLLKMASENLKMSPDELQSLLKKGDVSAIMSKMDGKDAQRLKDALKNPDIENIMKKSPEMSDYMKNSK
ncbi:MAG: hypothetical protein FWF82_06575 [Oscillospiraceae bacterium]|nr:hypothetical protein [Oscillospiraceae bacterium]